MKRYPFIAIIMTLCLSACTANTTTQLEATNMEEYKPMETMENEDGDITVEQIGNSVYVRFHFSRGDFDTFTRRYLDITSLLSADEFTELSQKIITLGNKEMVQKMADYWYYESTDYGVITTSHEMESIYPNSRYEININGYGFVYYPNGTSPNEEYYLSEWNYNVPNSQEGHVYMRIIYGNNYFDFTTDDEFLEIAEKEIEKIRLL